MSPIPWSDHRGIRPFQVGGHLVGSWTEAQEKGMVAAYRPRKGRPRHVATSIILSGWHPEFICDHASIRCCYPVGTNSIRLADRLRKRSREFGTETTMRVTATLTFNIEGKGIDHITRCLGYGGKWGIPPR